MEILEGLCFFQRGYLVANHLACRDSGGAVLVDTGYLTHNDRTMELLGSVGVGPADVKRIICTHTHCDHVGANAHIQGSGDATVAMHPRGRAIADSFDGHAGWWDYYAQQVEPYRCTETLEDGDEVAIGPYPFRVIHLPGHSSDLIGLYHPAEKVLVSSDALWQQDMAVVNAPVEGPDAAERWLSSLEKLARLDAKLVLPGHGPPFADFVEAVGRTRSRLERLIAEPEQVGRDIVRKILTYTLLMHGPVAEEGFFDSLMATQWYPEAVDTYLGGDRKAVYEHELEALVRKGVVRRRDTLLDTTVKR